MFWCTSFHATPPSANMELRCLPVIAVPQLSPALRCGAPDAAEFQLQVISSAEESEAVAASVDGTAGVYFVPAFSGLLAPRWRSDARGIIVGLTSYSSKVCIPPAALDASGRQRVSHGALLAVLLCVRSHACWCFSRWAPAAVLRGCTASLMPPVPVPRMAASAPESCIS